MSSHEITSQLTQTHTTYTSIRAIYSFYNARSWYGINNSRMNY